MAKYPYIAEHVALIGWNIYWHRQILLKSFYISGYLDASEHTYMCVLVCFIPSILEFGYKETGNCFMQGLGGP